MSKSIHTSDKSDHARDDFRKRHPRLSEITFIGDDRSLRGRIRQHLRNPPMRTIFLIVLIVSAIPFAIIYPKVSKVAQDYKNNGHRWVVVGDYNYGEGSSREHAALSPRLLGAAAIIARGFARIHESNLKKQGILPLVFSDPKHYELVQETDSISLLDLDKLEAAETVKCVLHHKDGTADVLHLNHSLSTGQIGWIKAGSALNVLHQST